MWVVLRTGPEAGRRYELTGDRTLVGRSDECGIRLSDDNASRRHAAFEPAGDEGVLLRDLGSANGTFVDGERVETATLQGGEQLQFGDTLMLVEREAGGGETVMNAPGRQGHATDPKLAGGVIAGSMIQRALQADSMFRQAITAPKRARRTAIVTALAVVGAMVGIVFATGILPAGSRPIADVVEEVAPATALVEVLDETGTRASTGTGWVLDAGAGLVVTNAHVVNGGARFRVALEGRARDARLFSVAPCEDLAVLRVADTSGLKELELGSQADVRSGDTVVAVGYPGNASLKDDLTSTEGIVSVVSTSYREPAPDVPAYSNVIQTDAALNPGNSGGPLVDLDGRLVGVNSAGRTSTEEGRVIQGQSYAIGVDRVREVLTDLREGRSRAWPGFGFTYPTVRVLEEQRLPTGLFVQNVVAGTPAADAGLDEELLIVSANGRAVSNSLAGWCSAAGRLRSGETVQLEVVRPGSRGQRSLELRLP